MAPQVPTRTTAVPYDFRRPNKFTREHVRALEIASETFARQFTTVLSMSLRSLSSVSLVSVGQLTYDEYVRAIPNPSYLAVLNLSPLQGTSLFHIPLPIVMGIVDRLLGGAAEGAMPNRAITDIESALMKDLMTRALHELSYGFETLIAGLQPELVLQESNPQFAQIASVTDMVVVPEFEIRVGGQEAMATLCIPFASLQPVLDELTGKSLAKGPQPTDPGAVRTALGARLDTAPAPVTVRFKEVTLSSNEIVDLRPGDVLPLHHPVDEPLTVSVAGVERFTAVPGRRGKRLACVVVERKSQPDQTFA
jgi:flagellar motor switch protein FliM